MRSSSHARVRHSRLALVVLAALGLLAPASRAEAPATVRLNVDTDGPTTRLVLTASSNVSATVAASRGKIEIVYSAPVDIGPREGRLDDPILARWETRGERTLVLRTGEGYKSYEVFQLKNPTRLVVDLEGDRPVRAGRGREEAPPPGFVVVLDPGHGGVETGAIGPSGLEEKALTLDLCRRLKTVLQQDPAVAVVLTRDEDRLVPLDERTAIANHNRADLFVSVHLNSFKRRKPVGAETYFLSPDATDDEARTVAALENRAYEPAKAPDAPAAETLPGLDLVLWDLAQNQYLAESGRLAESIQAELNVLAGTKNRGVRQAPFRVLMGATMPAVLVEVGFISNPDEEAKLQGESHRNRIVEALARAIARYRKGASRLDIPEASPRPEEARP